VRQAARTELAKVLVRLDAMPRIEAENDRLRAGLEQARLEAVKQHEIAAVAAATLEAELKHKHKQSVETQLAEATKRADSAVQIRTSNALRSCSIVINCTADSGSNRHQRS